MALVVWGRRSRVVARPAVEPRWQRLRGGRGLHRIGHRGAFARNVAASLLTAALASGAGWQATQHLTWDSVAGVVPDSTTVTGWVAAWTSAPEMAVRPSVALLDRADPSPSASSAEAGSVEPPTNSLMASETVPGPPAMAPQTTGAVQDLAVPAPPAVSTMSALTAPAAQAAQSLPPPQAAAVPARQLPSAHVVAAGETLSAIAAQYGTTVADIVTLNKLSDPNKLVVGDRLHIPR